MMSAVPDGVRARDEGFFEGAAFRTGMWWGSGDILHHPSAVLRAGLAFRQRKKAQDGKAGVQFIPL